MTRILRQLLEENTGWTLDFLEDAFEVIWTLIGNVDCMVVSLEANAFGCSFSHFAFEGMDEKRRVTPAVKSELGKVTCCHIVLANCVLCHRHTLRRSFDDCILGD